MDPISAIGLAGNVVAFIEFASNLIISGIELHHAKNGTTSTNDVLEKVTRDLHNVCDGLVSTKEHNDFGSHSDLEAEISPLMGSCRSLGQELLTTLKSIQVEGQRKAWDSAWKTLRCAWKARDIKRLEGQLASLRSQLTTRLLTVLRCV